MKSSKIHLILFILTIFTTLWVGAEHSGVDVINNPLLIYKGIPFSFSLLTILLVHELGHYLMTKRHRVRATLPYFIPAPSIFGTFGAFIKMESNFRDRKILLDIGATGPLAGFLVAVPFTIIGLNLSEVRITEALHGYSLGSSLLFSFLINITLGNIPDNANIILNPVAFAGWIGLLVTSLNLIPIGQLDGGHLSYAIFGEKHYLVSNITLIVLIIMGIHTWQGWLFWAMLLIVMGLRHPSPLNPFIPLDKKRKWIGILTCVIFIITFTPFPIKYV